MASLTRRADVLESIAAHAVVLLAVCFSLYPILWVVSLAFAGAPEFEPQVLPIPHEPTLEPMREVVGSTRVDAQGNEIWLFGRQLGNSLLVSIATALVGVAIAIPTAYAFARFEFVGRREGMRLLLATQMFPAVASAVPLFMILEALELLNTRTGLVLCYASTSVPFAVFQLRSAFEAIPIDLEEAAMVDGATRTQAFLKVALPAARPAISVTMLFAFMSAWNEFILAATLLGRESAFTLPVVLQSYVGEYNTQWGAFAAGAVLVSVPVMALFYVAQRQLLSGLTAGGVKG